MTDHDILIRLCEKVDLLNLNLTNHLAHHARYTLALLVALISTLTAFGLHFLRVRSRNEQEKPSQK